MTASPTGRRPAPPQLRPGRHRGRRRPGWQHHPRPAAPRRSRRRRCPVRLPHRPSRHCSRHRARPRQRRPGSPRSPPMRRWRRHRTRHRPSPAWGHRRPRRPRPRRRPGRLCRFLGRPRRLSRPRPRQPRSPRRLPRPKRPRLPPGGPTLRGSARLARARAGTEVACAIDCRAVATSRPWPGHRDWPGRSEGGSASRQPGLRGRAGRTARHTPFRPRAEGGPAARTRRACQARQAGREAGQARQGRAPRAAYAPGIRWGCTGNATPPRSWPEREAANARPAASRQGRARFARFRQRGRQWRRRGAGPGWRGQRQGRLDRRRAPTR